MNADIKAYSEKQESSDRKICELLSSEIDKRLPEAQSKIWQLLHYPCLNCGTHNK